MKLMFSIKLHRVKFSYIYFRTIYKWGYRTKRVGTLIPIIER